MLKTLKGENYLGSVHKRARIKAFDRLLGLAQTKNYRGRPLGDHSQDDHVHAVKTWLQLNEHEFAQAGNLFTITIKDNEFVFDVSHTPGLSQLQVKTRESVLASGGEYHVLREFHEFLKIWDQLI